MKEIHFKFYSVYSNKVSAQNIRLITKCSRYNSNSKVNKIQAAVINKTKPQAVRESKLYRRKRFVYFQAELEQSKKPAYWILL